jgi:hypothetical protein
MGGLFGGGKGVSNTAPVISSIQLQTSSFGRAIPWIFGQQRVAPNLIQYEDFTAIAHTSQQKTGKGGGGKATNTEYTYTVAAAMALGSGTLAGISRTWKDKERTSLAELKLDYYNGSETQEPYPYFVSKHPDRALSYRGIAYVASGAYDLGSSAGFGNHTFEVQAHNSVGEKYAGSGVPDAEPVDVITALLTDTVQGVGIDPDSLGDLSAFRSYCLANSLWVSPAYTEQKGAYEYIKTLLTIGFADCVYSGGKFKIVPYSDVPADGKLASYRPTIAPVCDLGADDFITGTGDDPVRITQKSAEECYNHVRVKFRDRANDYNENVAESKDDADIEQHGLRSMDVVDMPEIADAAVAQKVADFILHRSLYILNTYEFRLSWKYVRLEPMDVVTLTYGPKFLDQTPVLITNIDEDDDGLLTIQAEDYPIGSNRHSSQPVPDIGSNAPNYAVHPGDVRDPVIFEPPPKLTGNESQLWMAVAGGQEWGGAVVWASTDDRSYQRIGTVRGSARYGALTGPLAAGQPIDQVGQLPVDLSVSAGELTGATPSSAEDLLTTSYVGGEYIAFANAALTAKNSYTLSYLVRGAYGSTIAAHAAGEPFVFLDSSLFRYSYPHDWVGKTVYVKLTSYNKFGGAMQDLSEVKTYQRKLEGSKVASLTSLVAVGRVFAIQVDWGLPLDAALYLDHTEVWYGPTPHLIDAVKLDSFATPQNSHTITGLAAGKVMYFWVRVVDKMGNLGAFYPAGDGVKGQTVTDAGDILSYLAGAIGKTQLASDLLAPIESAEQIIGPVMDKINAVLHGGQNEELAATQLLGAISADSALTAARKKLGDNIAAAVANEKKERVTATEALASQISTVSATTNNNTALIQQETTARTTAVEAVSSQLTVIAANVDKNTAAIQTEATSRATADSAMSSRIDVVGANTDKNTAAVLAEQTARTTADSALSTRIDAVVATAAGNTAAITSEQTARANADGALSTRIDTVAANVAANAAAITSEQTARANAEGALSSRIDTVSASAGNANAAAQTAATAIADTNGKLAAMYTIKVQTSANGHKYMAALGLGVENNGGVQESQILASAQRFAIIDESSGNLVTPFVVQGGQVFINEAFIGNAWIGNAQIKNAAVDTLTIAGNAVTQMATAQGTNSAAITISTHGAPVFLSAVAVASWGGWNNSTDCSINLIMKRDGVQIASFPASQRKGSDYDSLTLCCPGVYVDPAAPAGTHTYSFEVGVVGYPGQAVSVNCAVLEARR